ncbi:MAG: hypothetical protein A3I07_02685 [Candidatus Doudnabacteria bacterium RIFCSPLOWO2_02_FULL_42_9]|uniref:Type II secretion system protein GspI C-terminal domain-containing protein n=1 Tax=Candidatus Doudnabacteria bacterium RIFCSPHIGHO2_01_FULL_41_86 TaxID=1817821 RepID=A0A1F5N9T6_9BACT|nr:MAG: hypothetical protein A2717_02215 [Candidatus Doudnabacteria bacterium RIFCSPHIGHO2_01_FULL_41_86]OGE75576.1 MAG: hypothetical protein A3K07_01970 [Candidatus Doudnabacteria bacterium RIFCSPHIGHO2_01_43_10]OGE85372.1 MAG: hypothetical protein A3E28_01785 [Candidatus Doudnabacteria bacterium RIFCSPHIGHO2_12_FULL_42_22]OGE86910.1 MAG: hypothetical protein A3C49_02620 [Candidatus Doudnabacteria bacterium RIFCSPHIGHO2_02_FULL_42_25]OGE92509.1 MAG: hypothetical protein A2895_02775 [Candidatus
MNHITRQKGTSLVEVILVMFVLFVLVIFYASALNTVALTRKLRYENLAYHVANKQMETLRNTTFDTLPAGGVVVDPMLAQIPSGSGDFTVVDYPGFAGIKEITITVNWNDGVNKQIILRTLAGLEGINP